MPTRALLMLAILSSTAAAQAPDTSATKASILAADRAVASSSSREDAFISSLDPGAPVLIPGQPILRGPSAARTALIARYGSPSAYSWNAVHAVVSTDGRFGCTMGYSRFSNAADSMKAERRGTYLVCWKKGDDGKWRIVGAQRADSPPSAPLFVDSITLPGAPHSATVSKTTNALAEAQDADSLFAMMGAEPAGPGLAFAKYVADDGMLIGGPEFPRGPVQIQAGFEGYSPDRVISWRPMRNVGAGSGGLAFTVGNATSGARAGKTGPTNYNKYMTVWRQEPDGRWLYIFDLGSPRPVPLP